MRTNKLIFLFNYLGACSQWEAIYKDKEGNFYRKQVTAPIYQIQKEYAKDITWFHLNSTQSGNPTQSEINNLLQI